MNASGLQQRWYSDRPPPTILKPLSWLYGRIADARRRRLQALAQSPGVPVIVVGNISVGGTGKTPFVIWLVARLREWGFRPGVVSRGYGGRAGQYPCVVDASADAAAVGDEPLLIARATQVPVVVDPQRAQAARYLVDRFGVDLIVADDGLQHYRLHRDLEICVVDGARGFGNGARLPAGPLREPVDRLHEIPLMVVNGGALPLAHPGRIDMQLVPGAARALGDGSQLALAELRGQAVHAVAGIGHPQRFFAMLRDQGLAPIEHPFADHHQFSATDLDFGDRLPVLMTEKDAVKCERFARQAMYCVPVEAQIPQSQARLVQQSCESLKS